MTDGYTLTHRVIPEDRVPGKPLGRRVLHDSRSKAYRPAAAAPGSVKWLRRSPILNQGNVGSCTGNASDGVLGTDPFYSTLPAGFDYGEATAVKIYSLGTKLDTYPGTYPPTDTGCDGLSVAKACKQLGWISGYTHALSLDEFLAGMQKGPAITGFTWLTGCDNPDGSGMVRWSGKVRGGHEVEADEIDVDRERVWFCNSWGTGFGVSGRFWMSFADYGKALADQGDATFFVPLNQPAPTPTPPPAPAGGLTWTAANALDAASVKAFAASPHVYRVNTRAAKALNDGSWA